MTNAHAQAIDQAQAALYATTRAGWQAIESWCDDPVNAVAASRVQGAIWPLHTAWQNIDRGVFTDPGLLAQAYQGLLGAEAAAAAYGYPAVQRAGGAGIRRAGGDDGPSVFDDPMAAMQHAASSAYNAVASAGETVGSTAHSAVSSVQQTAQDAGEAIGGAAHGAVQTAQETAQSAYQSAVDAANVTAEQFSQWSQAQKDAFCKEYPKICKTLDPDLSWCQKPPLELSDTYCDKDGIRSWVWYAMGLSAGAMTLGVVYVAYKAAKVAAPFAIAAYAPEALPAYQALQRGDQEAAQEHAIQMAQQYGAQQRAAKAAGAAAGGPPIVGQPIINVPGAPGTTTTTQIGIGGRP